MAISLSKPSQLAFFQEVTQGTPPADASAWNSSGTRIKHMDLDVSGIVQAAVENMNSQTRVFGKNKKVPGLKNVDGIPYATYMTGTGATTSGGSQVDAIALSNLLAHCLGGQHRSNSTTIETVTSQVELVLGAATNIVPGCYIAIRDTSAGICEPVRVLTVSSETVTIDKAPSFTVTTSDTVEACITVFVDEAELADAESAGPNTFSYLAQKGNAGALQNYELRGCKTQLETLEFTRGELVKGMFKIFAANFLDTAGSAPSPTWTSSEAGNRPVVVGVDTICHLQDEGTTTAALIDVTELSVDVGVPVVRVPTLTETDTNMEGTATYCTADADTVANVSMVPYDTGLIDDFTSGTQYKTFRWAKLADRGAGFAVALHKCEVASYPARGEGEGYATMTYQLRAHEDDDNSSASDADLWKTKLALVLY